MDNPDILTIEAETENERYGKYICDELASGYGTMLGVGMRRILLSSIIGDAIISVKIDGVWHEFSTLPGVVEDVTRIILNLKEVRLKMPTGDERTVRIDVDGEREVTAKDITGEVEILNPDQHIATLDEEGSLHFEMQVVRGRGYVPAEKNKRPGDIIGIIPVDAIFSPIIRVNYTVDKLEGDEQEREKLSLEVWTDGTISPKEAVGRAAKIFIDELRPFRKLVKRVIPEPAEETETVIDSAKLGLLIEEMDFSVRAFNCLKRANINTMGELSQKTEAELEKVRNLGRKSIEEIRHKLASVGLSLRIEQ